MPNESEIHAAIAALVQKICPAEPPAKKALLKSNLMAAWQAGHAGKPVVAAQTNADPDAPANTTPKLEEIEAGSLARPVPALSPHQIEAIKSRGREYPWSQRPHRRMSTFDWIKDHYGEWIPGLLQSHLKMADSKLYFAFHQQMRRIGGLPEWLDVPNEDDARLRNLTDPAQRQALLQARVLKRDSNRIQRSVGLMRGRQSA